MLQINIHFLSPPILFIGPTVNKIPDSSSFPWSVPVYNTRKIALISFSIPHKSNFLSHSKIRLSPADESIHLGATSAHDSATEGGLKNLKPKP
jgi:hypothetical protein